MIKYEVTVREFLQFTKATDYKATNDCPVRADKDAYTINAPGDFVVI